MIARLLRRLVAFADLCLDYLEQPKQPAQAQTPSQSTMQTIQGFEDDLAKISATVARYRSDAIEKALITRIEEIEGRVPSDAEVAHYAQKEIHPDGTEIIYWKGIPIVVAPPIYRREY